MKRLITFLILTIFTLTIFSTFPFAVHTASAQSSGYGIQKVDHQMEVMYSGQIIIRDTIHVTGQVTDSFLIGFPQKFGAHVLKGMAYDENGILPMSLNVPFEGHSNLYGASISFPQAAPQVFTVVFILSNDLVHQNNTLNAAAVEFPAYPSLAKEAAKCNVTLVLPDFAANPTVTKDGESTSETSFVKNNLAAFTDSPAAVTFSMPSGILQLVSITNLNRVITVSPAGDVAASDSYRLVNNGNDSLVAFGVDVPLGVSNIIGKDDLGRNLAVEIVGNGSTFHLVNVSLASYLAKSQSVLLTVEYTLPRALSEQITTFRLNLEPFPYFDYYVTEASVTVVPPEGATFLTYDPTASLNKDGLQETLTYNKAGVSHVDLDAPSETVQTTYAYNPLWLSFRPTLWVWLLAAAGCIAVAFWKRPKTSTPPKTATPKLSMSLSPDHIHTFIEAYEEKTTITSKLSLLNERAQKGKIPRRRYKVQKRKLTDRSAALSKEIAELKEILRGGGGNCASLVRQLETAETELNKAETNINSVETRHRRGSISSEEYKKTLAEYQRQKEKAEVTINGILLRLREETR
jgi:hypothetical protein